MYQFTVSVVILAVPDRPSHVGLRESLAASDVGEYEFSYHEPGVPLAEHWLKTHQRAAEAPTPLVIVLEDDVIVNQHIAWNVGTWRWPLHPEFGAGWLYNPGGYVGKDVWYQGDPAWFGTCGVLYKTEMLPKIIDCAYPKIRGGEVMDCAMAQAIHRFGRIRVHHPALVEHMDKYPSIVGNPACEGIRTTRGMYREDWRRGDWSEHGLLDKFGRAQNVF